MAAISFIVLFYSFHWSNIIVLVLFVLLVLTGSIGTVFRNKALLLAYGVLSFAGLLLFGAALVVLPFTVFQTSFLTTVASMVSAVFVVVFFVRLSLYHHRRSGERYPHHPWSIPRCTGLERVLCVVSLLGFRLELELGSCHTRELDVQSKRLLRQAARGCVSARQQASLATFIQLRLCRRTRHSLATRDIGARAPSA